MPVNLMPNNPVSKPSEARAVEGESKEQQIKAAMKALESKKSAAAAEPEKDPKNEPVSRVDDKVTVQLDRKMLAAARQMMLNRKKRDDSRIREHKPEPQRSDTRS